MSHAKKNETPLLCLQFLGVGKSSLVTLICRGQPNLYPSWTIGAAVDVKVGSHSSEFRRNKINQSFDVIFSYKPLVKHIVGSVLFKAVSAVEFSIQNCHFLWQSSAFYKTRDTLNKCSKECLLTTTDRVF